MERTDSPAYEELGPTRRLTSCEPARQQSRQKPPGEVLRLIGELGLRYRPSAQADLEAHAAAIALLARDLADVPVKYLDIAIRRHVLQSPYMPKAAELVALAQTALEEDRPLRPFTGARPWEPAPFDESTRCTPEQATAIIKEFGLRRNPLDMIGESNGG